MRHYTDGDFVNLLEAAEFQGGQYVPETCAAKRIAELDLDQAPPAYGTGCAEDAKFIVSYDPHATVTVNEPRLIPDPEHEGRKMQERDEHDNLLWHPVEHTDDEGGLGELHMVHVCANDDLMRHWPRFQGVMKDPDPTTGVR